MKKLFLLLFIIALLFSICSCELLQANVFGPQEGNETKQEEPTNGQQEEPDDRQDNTDAQKEEPTGGEAASQTPSDPIDGFEILPANEAASQQQDADQKDKANDETTAQENKETSNKPNKTTYYSSYSSGSSSVTPTHIHVFDQQVPAEAYETGIVEGSTETYYYSCECGACGTETFEHDHVYDQQVSAEAYKAAADSEYYYSCTCGKYSTENGTFTVHVHVFDQKVPAAIYETGIVRGSIETYYYSCECGACGTETFQHNHVYNKEVPEEAYKAVAEGEYYFSCECGKYTTANGTFTSDVGLGEDTPGFGGLIDPN